MGGTHADLKAAGEHPYCAMMQVAEADKYEDYVICRGFDPRMRKFIDYEDGNPNKPGISVAKPFSHRIECYYQIGHVFPAFLTTQGPADYVPPSPSGVNWRVGQNPGTATSACVGQPKSLSGTITELLDHNNKYINWMLIDSGQLFFWVELDADLQLCGSAAASILAADASGEACDTCDYTSITVDDECGVVSSTLYYDEYGYIPAKYRALVMQVSAPQMAGRAGACKWVPVCFGTDSCCDEGSGSASSSSSSSSSSSLSSSSNLSSGGSGSNGAGSSSKSTAIVPASWSPDGYTALFIAESPEVRFDDVLTAELPQEDTTIPIDPKFIEVCGQGSIEVVGHSVDKPIPVGLKVNTKGSVEVAFSEQDAGSQLRLIVRLSGIRQGFVGHRFPNRTKEQFDANERFINSAYDL